MTEEQKLWVAVLTMQIMDAFPRQINAYSKPYMLAAWSWIGVYPGRSFTEVCELAGVDADSTHKILVRNMKMEPEDRMAYGKKIRNIAT